MCGIVGIYLKTKKFEKNLGKMLSGMLNNMESRGPDSAGFAIYKNSDRKEYKYSLCINNLNFSKFKKDLSNTETIEHFLDDFGLIIDNVTDYLDSDRYLAVVIGDKYNKGEWIPIGFRVMNEVLKRDYKLKSIIVKNYEETSSKKGQENLWRYRALVGGFYIFKHEYILLFQKK